MSYFNLDTHMHIDLYKNRDEIISYIENNKSYTIAMTNLPVLFEKYTNEYENMKYVKFALGFHPELAYKYEKQLAIFIDNAMKTRYIGEVGLDFVTKDKTNCRIQQKVFTTIIDECRKYGDKILSIHSRKAVKAVNDIICDFNGIIILHWYSGSIKELKRAISYGCYFSINHQMLRSEHGKNIITQIPLNRILIESDAPFTINMEETYNIGFIMEIYQHLSNLHSLSINHISLNIKDNFKRILVIPKTNYNCNL